ncbi:MAG: hypothetical protein GAK31_02233 [Stenotrophomonas maltophilia]|uniref:Uncharacterized protein n=1 Tax=Stenotrophomonas maltophilia TaxID=40324 RepID=A0A7V8JLH4_STEMA|nr:MAG: hypothetical protein GAK31_02233 [Stenotrophomonas maltophilia]
MSFLFGVPRLSLWKVAKSRCRRPPSVAVTGRSSPAKAGAASAARASTAAGRRQVMLCSTNPPRCAPGARQSWAPGGASAQSGFGKLSSTCQRFVRCSVNATAAPLPRYRRAMPSVQPTTRHRAARGSIRFPLSFPCRCSCCWSKTTRIWPMRSSAACAAAATRWTGRPTAWLPPACCATRVSTWWCWISACPSWMACACWPACASAAMRPRC